MGMGVLVNCHLCWAYTAERLLATVCMKSYEKQRPWFGTLTTLLIVVLTAVVVGHDTIASKEITVSRNTILAGFSFPAVGLVCLVTMAFLNRHNARRYRVGAKYTAFIHLSERYQNSENVRTTSQLAPLIFFHFLAGLLLAAFYASALFTLSTEVRFFILTSLSVTSCFAYIGCQVAVLYFHQGVRKRAQSKLTKLTKTFASAVWTTETRQGPNAYASKNSSVVFFKTIKADWDHEYEKRLGRFK